MRAAAEDGRRLRHLESLRHLFGLEAPPVRLTPGRARGAPDPRHAALAAGARPDRARGRRAARGRARDRAAARSRPPATAGAPRGTGAAPDKGLFVKELEEALLDGRAHLAVHSAKDLPGELPDGLAVLAVPAARGPARRAGGPARRPRRRCPPGARVATGSPRRAAQILAARPDLGRRADPRQRGDPPRQAGRAARPTRWCSPPPACARLGLSPAGAEPLCGRASARPRPGQGLLAVEGRAGDAEAGGRGRGARRPRGPRLPAGRARVPRRRSAAGAWPRSAPSASPTDGGPAPDGLRAASADGTARRAGRCERAPPTTPRASAREAAAALVGGAPVSGIVHLVGAGPGDPGLITVAGRRRAGAGRRGGARPPRHRGAAGALPRRTPSCSTPARRRGGPR